MNRPLHDLGEKPFDLPDWVRACQNHLNQVMVRIPEKVNAEGVRTPAHFVNMPFFGTIFVGFDNIPDMRWKEFTTSDLHQNPAPAFKCPMGWTLARVLGNLKVFQSIGEAKRNGWDSFSPEGWEDHKVRVAKIQGILTVVTPTAVVLDPLSWDRITLEEND